jgi:hypothetical protein
MAGMLPLMKGQVVSGEWSPILAWRKQIELIDACIKLKR